MIRGWLHRRRLRNTVYEVGEIQCLVARWAEENGLLVLRVPVTREDLAAWKAGAIVRLIDDGDGDPTGLLLATVEVTPLGVKEPDDGSR